MHCTSAASRLVVIVVLCLLRLPLSDRPAHGQETPFAARFEKGVVAADHPAASEAGADMLRRGGNVVDAAVATSFALSVVRPASCGIGGGGFMLIWDARKRQAVALDYRERAPMAATADMFAKDPQGSRLGGKAVAVPGTVAGLCYALKEYGTLELHVVLGPAIALAKSQPPLDDHDRDIQRGLEKRPSAQGTPRQVSDMSSYRLAGDESPQLNALRLLAKEGPDAFYQGEIARAIVATVERTGGVMSLEDLAEMKPVVRQPLRGTFGDLQILTMPPPSSGGIAILETLGILAAYDAQHPDKPLKSLDRRSPVAIHRIAEALKHAFADRAEYLGDPDFVDVPTDKLLDPARLARLARKIDAANTLPPESYGRFEPPKDAGTSHFSVMDAEGNAVACTETINLSYGSHVVVPNYGIVLNNEMDDFTSVPGKPNAFGLLQSAQNAISPRKKPLSSMSPTFVFKAGDPNPVAAVGASGGPRIITSTLQIMLNSTFYDLSPGQAVQSPRFHHQWMPNELLLEPSLDQKVSKELTLFGHRTQAQGALAVGQLVRRQKDGLWGASDPRKGGRPAGW